MKKLFLILCILGICKISIAQWTSGSGTSYTTDKVGIGTATPAEELSVSGNGSSGSISLNPGTGTYSSYKAEFTTQADDEGFRLLFGGYKVLTTEGYNTPEITKLYSNNAETMTLNSGNVGIGTTGPGAKHEVYNSSGGLHSVSNSVIDNFAYHAFEIAGSNTGNIQWNVGEDGIGNGTAMILNNGQGNLHLWDETDEGITISDGNVGIGTIIPSEKLAVNGNIVAKEVKVTLTSASWPDHVFNKNYALQPLSEVEKFIKTNQHLPEIPSAKEVHENGVNLGGMSSKLLQKIEELTLYIIEQNKIVEKQGQLIDTLLKKANRSEK